MKHHPLASNALPSLLLVVLVVLLVQTPTTTLAQGQNLTFISYLNCSVNSETFIIGGQFDLNLGTLLDSLSSSIISSSPRFSSNGLGSDPDAVFGLGQCRGDVTEQECGLCLTTAKGLIRQNCGNQKAAIIRMDYCMLRYSNLRFFNQMDSLPRQGWYYNDVAATDVAVFNEQLRNLLNTIRAKAIDSPSKYSDGSIVSGSSVIYGLVQCTGDISSSDCSACIQTMYDFIPSCCDGKFGGWILSPSCQIWYRTDFRFFHSP